MRQYLCKLYHNIEFVLYDTLLPLHTKDCGFQFHVQTIIIVTNLCILHICVCSISSE
jgi:hypothetical protein